MVPADHSSASDVEYGHDCFRPVGRHGDHIAVIAVAGFHFLPLGDLENAAAKIAIRRCVLKFQFRGRLLHLLRQHAHHRLVVAAEEVHGLVHFLSVVLL